MLYNNASIGDALFTGTPAGAGGVTVSAGGDNYQIDHNWIAGNLSTGDGGGLQSLGVTFNGRINNNYILFNQSTNPTLPTNGGGIIVQGANEPRMINGNECGATTDFDCPPGLGDGTGAGLVIDGNLILGNSAESGSGGGLRLQQINGSEMIQFPVINSRWYGVTVTNNIIANNVAGWDGGGVSMEDALKVSFVNNTVVSNDTTASAGALFKTLGAVNASSAPPGCTNDPTQLVNLTCPTDGAPHAPQPAGLVTLAHSYNLREAIGNLPVVAVGGINVGNLKVLCPVVLTGQDFGYTGTVFLGVNTGANGDCMAVSKPRMVNDLFWHNRAFSVDVVDASGNIVSGTATPTGTDLQSQQNLIALNPMLNQTSTGQCVTPSGSIPPTFYYDVGLRTDDVAAGAISFGTNKLRAYNSIVSGDPQSIVNHTNRVAASSSPVVAEYCNGARVAPEKSAGIAGAFAGYNAPPGASETTGLPTVFVFNGIQPAATVDEGHNWLNLVYGPLTMNRSAVSTTPTNNPPELMVASASVGVAGGSYSIPGASPAAASGLVSGLTPASDFFGQSRPASAISVGAVQVAVVAQPPTLTSIAPSSGNQGATVAVALTGTNLGGASAVNVSGSGVSCNITGTPTMTSVTASCSIALSASTGVRDVTVATPAGRSNILAFTVNALPAPTTPTGGNSTRGGTGNPVTANLTWNATQYAASYDVQWSTLQANININTGTVITSASTTNSYTFNATGSVTSGTTVYFKVRAVNSAGTSGWSTSFNSAVR